MSSASDDYCDGPGLVDRIEVVRAILSYRRVRPAVESHVLRQCAAWWRLMGNHYFLMGETEKGDPINCFEPVASIVWGILSGASRWEVEIGS